MGVTLDSSRFYQSPPCPADRQYSAQEESVEDVATRDRTSAIFYIWTCEVAMTEN